MFMNLYLQQDDWPESSKAKRQSESVPQAESHSDVRSQLDFVLGQHVHARVLPRAEGVEHPKELLDLPRRVFVSLVREDNTGEFRKKNLSPAQLHVT